MVVQQVFNGPPRYYRYEYDLQGGGSWNLWPGNNEAREAANGDGAMDATSDEMRLDRWLLLCTRSLTSTDTLQSVCRATTSLRLHVIDFQYIRTY